MLIVTQPGGFHVDCNAPLRVQSRRLNRLGCPFHLLTRTSIIESKLLAEAVGGFFGGCFGPKIRRPTPKIIAISTGDVITGEADLEIELYDCYTRLYRYGYMTSSCTSAGETDLEIELYDCYTRLYRYRYMISSCTSAGETDSKIELYDCCA